MATAAPSPDGPARLIAAVASSPRVNHHPQQKPHGRARAIQLCLLAQPPDTWESLAARHPELGEPHKIQARMIALRQYIPDLRRNVHLSPYQIAHMYLATIPAHLRRLREP